MAPSFFFDFKKKVLTYHKTGHMKMNVDWFGLLKAVLKAALPFCAGALGGIASGCSVFGPGVGACAY